MSIRDRTSRRGPSKDQSVIEQVGGGQIVANHA